MRILVRELRVLVYSQFLESYKSVRLASMAEAFGVSIDFLDKYVSGSAWQELSCLTAMAGSLGRLTKWWGIIHTQSHSHDPTPTHPPPSTFQ